MRCWPQIAFNQSANFSFIAVKGWLAAYTPSLLGTSFVWLIMVLVQYLFVLVAVIFVTSWLGDKPVLESAAAGLRIFHLG